ncbi:ABC transporter ATP-binding protein (plasmid) [Streptomyces sp. CA-142005]|uniref:ABC transporter ATP-binding protein n=1 Tax=Streptomyces sp. CA-142005 TaxID=3240052 RepID=UPI003D8C35D7
MRDAAPDPSRMRAPGAESSPKAAIEVVRAEQLVKTYRRPGTVVRALRGVDLVAGCGEFVAVTGPPGAGKSTLLHVLAGLERPDGGRLDLAGERVDEWSGERWVALRRQRVGLVLSSLPLLPPSTVAGMIELRVLLAGGSSAAARERRAEVLNVCGLQGYEGCLPGELSRRERRRVAIAVALVHRPALLLVDEAADGLEARDAGGALHLLRRLHERGQTLVVVTHDARVAATADRVVSLSGGRVVDDVVLGVSGNARTVGVSDVVELAGYRPLGHIDGRPGPSRLP